jgi:hypothetical protein
VAQGVGPEFKPQNRKKKKKKKKDWIPINFNLKIDFNLAFFFGGKYT